MTAFGWFGCLAGAALVVATGVAVWAAEPPAASRPAPVSTVVMTFNIRYGSADDGADAWPKRKGMLFDLVRKHDADLIGMQEVLDFQADELKAKFPDYGFAGVGREDGKRKGEFAPIFYRSDRYDRLNGGVFWLSETPEVVASLSWDSSLTRLATWVKLRDRRDADRIVLFVNTHWDHRGQVARRESAKLICERISKLAKAGEAVILSSDFNTTEDDPAYKTLTAHEPGAIRLVDGYRAAHPARGPEEITFHGFKGTTHGSRIDFILHSEAYLTVSAEIDRTSAGGHFPSDHYPVVLKLMTAEQ